MDDRRFDSLAKAFASGKTRRSMLKGILGLGGAALAGGVLLENDAAAARRPATKPKPVTCSGQQTWNGTACVCPGSAPDECGPDCCTDSITLPDTPGYSECCDNACCFGHCYGEELCCEYPLVFCEAQNECCFAGDNQCCGSTGCCDTACCPIADGTNACCEDPTPKCCGGDACIPADGCCVDADCPGCQSCQDHICVDDDAFCPGGVAGCQECISASCQQINANCSDGNACTNDVCHADGSCSNTFNCNLAEGCCVDSDPCTANVCNDNGTCSFPFFCSSNGCCNDGNACTQNICNTGTGACSYPFYCTSDGCCEGDLLCNTSTGACYDPCVSTPFEPCGPGCCSGLTCINIPTAGDYCVDCIPSIYGGTPVPCLDHCDLCCEYDYLGFCVSCNPPFNSCEHDENSCCPGLCCQYNVFGDNFCSVACI